MTDTLLTLSHATERDVDLLLVEELKCSAPFARWFANNVTRSPGAPLAFDRAQIVHSKRRLHNRREIDITALLEGGGLPTALLIENKLDTLEQPNQAESYRDEARALVASGRVANAYTALVCPKAYLAAHPVFAAKFDRTITYEQIVDFLRGRAREIGGELSERILHRLGLLEQAITKARRGYEAVPVAEIDSFNTKYVALLTRAGLNLPAGPSMLKAGRPGESKTMIFSPSALPRWACLPQTRLVHQLREGNANINLYGWGNHFSKLAGAIAPDLAGTPYRLVPTVNKRIGGNSGLMIVADTPQIDNLLGFDEQEEAILRGMEITGELKDWFWRNQSAVERWATLLSRFS